MNTVELKYGKEKVAIKLHGAKSVEILNEQPMDEIKVFERSFYKRYYYRSCKFKTIR